MANHRSNWTKCLALVGIGILVGWMVPGPPSSNAKDERKSQPPRIGYVNIAEVLGRFDRGHVEGAKITKRRLELVDTVNNERKKLTETTEKLAATKDPEEQREIKARAESIQKRIEEIDKKAAEELSALSNATVIEIYDQIQSVVRSLAEEHNLDVVQAFTGVFRPEDERSAQVAERMLQSSALIPFYLKPEFDLSTEVVERLNKKFPPVD